MLFCITRRVLSDCLQDRCKIGSVRPVVLLVSGLQQGLFPDLTVLGLLFRNRFLEHPAKRPVGKRHGVRIPGAAAVEARQTGQGILQVVSHDLLKGYMMAPWTRTFAIHEEKSLQAVAQMAAAIKARG